MSVLLTEPILIIRRTPTVDAAGRPLDGETQTPAVGAFRRRLASDAADGGLVATEEVEFFLAGEPDVAVGDMLEARGERYEVVAAPYPQVNFRTHVVHHRVVRGRRRQR